MNPLLDMYETKEQTDLNLPLEEQNWIKNKRNPRRLKNSMEILIDNPKTLENQT